MRSLVLWITVVIVAGLGVWWWSSRASPPRTTTPALEAPSRASDTSDAPHAPETALAEPVAKAALDRVVPEILDAPPSAIDASDAAATPTARIFGRVVDEVGRPLAQASVRVAQIPIDGSFRGGRPPAPVTTDVDGRFEVSTPVASSVWNQLTVTPDALHMESRRAFGAPDARGRPKLVPGDNDQGDIVLVAAGAVTGRVLDERGAPIAKAQVFVPNDELVASRTATTDVDGRFVVGHLRAGTRRGSINAEGYFSVTDTTFPIEVGRTLTMPDVTLTAAPSISGVVVDEAGQGVAQVLVSANPARGGMLTMAHTGKDGTFRFTVRSPGTHSLNVVAPEGYAPPSPGKDAATKAVEPGATDVRVVLTRAGLVTFRVIDEASGSPIPSFGLQVETKAGANRTNRANRILTPRQTPSVQLAATPGEFIAYVAATGHAPRELDVVLDAGSDDTMTIALKRGGVLRGRVVSANPTGSAVPVAGVLVALARETRDERGLLTLTPGGIGLKLTSDLGSFTGGRRTQESREDGTFVFEDLAHGTYGLVFTSSSTVNAMRREIVVGPSATVDLGDVTVEAGATIRGRLLSPPGESPVGFSILVNSFGTDPKSVAWIAQKDVRIEDPQGQFEIRGLPGGRHHVAWTRPGVTNLFGDASGPNMQVLELGPAEVRELVLDASNSKPCTLHVTVTRAGRPVANARVSARIESSGERPSFETRNLGVTDAEGRATGSIDGGLTFRATVVTTDGRELARADASMVAPAGGEIDVELDVRTGRLELQLPETMVRPESGRILLNLSGTDRSLQMFRVTTEEPGMFEATSARWTGARVELGDVPVGTYTATVQFQREEANPADPKRRVYAPLREPHKTSVTIELDRTATITVP